MNVLTPARLTAPAVSHAVSSVASSPFPFGSARLVGVGGSGMKALAEILLDLGIHITGSDRQPGTSGLQDLQRRGLRIDAGHQAAVLPTDADALIYSPAIPANNPERIAAREIGIPQFSMIDVLAGLMHVRTGVCIAGTHGKSTTTAMTAWILQQAGQSPTAFIGAGLRETDRNGFAGTGHLFVVESCEYQRNFLQFRPQHAVILGIEPDHFETFPDDASLIDGFARFAANVHRDGTLLISGDCRRSLVAAQKAEVAVETYGSTSASDWWFDNVRQNAAGMRFRLFHRDVFVTEVTLPIPGRHNVRNAVAAAALCATLGIPARAIREALQEFPGIRRRFEPVGSWRGVTVIDDYAHHPTAVRITLETARDVFGSRRLWCVFQPHQRQRTERLIDEFAAALSLADRVLIPPVFAARETDGRQSAAVSEALATRVSAGAKARYITSLDRILPTLEDEARPGDVVMLMGAGDMERVHYDFARSISRHHSHAGTAGAAYLAEAGGAGGVFRDTAR